MPQLGLSFLSSATPPPTHTDTHTLTFASTHTHTPSVMSAPERKRSKRGRIVVFSGGTAFNALAR